MKDDNRRRKRMKQKTNVDKRERKRMKANSHVSKTTLINFELVQILITVNESFRSFHLLPAGTYSQLSFNSCSRLFEVCKSMKLMQTLACRLIDSHACFCFILKTPAKTFTTFHIFDSKAYLPSLPGDESLEIKRTNLSSSPPLPLFLVNNLNVQDIPHFHQYILQPVSKYNHD